MFYLSDGKPKFYIGKVNDVGYTTEEEKKEIIIQLKKDNPDVEVTDEPVDIDKNLKNKAIELGELQLTYSKSEFMKYLNGEKHIPKLEIERLKEENKKLQNEIRDMSTINKANILALMEVNSRLNKMESDK